MNEYFEGIIEEVKHYIEDDTYAYAILLDGSWGIGKTHFVRNLLMHELSENDSSLNGITVKYVSIYGCSSREDIHNIILETILSDYIDAIIDKTLDERTRGQKKSNKAKYIKKGLSFIERSVSFFLAQKGLGIEKTDVLNEIIDLSHYFLIIDDIERCTCSITETLGIFNELVEHDFVKMLLVANENEITNSSKSDSNNEALKYLVASNKDIVVEMPENISGISKSQPDKQEGYFGVDRLKERASYIFSSQPQRNYYDVVKEKLIGHTIRFQPDISTTMHQIICDTVGSTSILNDILNNQVGKYCDYFIHYKHPNFRTFQFFISKAVFLYNHCSRMKFQKQYYKRAIMEAMTLQCFIACIIYKARLNNIGNSLWTDMVFPLKVDIPFITDYVEAGIYNTQIAKRDLQHYVDTNINVIISADDPLLLLRNSYYLNTEKWVSDTFYKMVEQLKENYYPTSFYAIILEVTCNLISIGFDEEWYKDVENQMRNLIEQYRYTDAIASPAIYSPETKEYKQLNKTIDELNEIILANASKGRTKTLEAVLKSHNWVSELEQYIASEKNKNTTSMFSRIPTETWVSCIVESLPDDVYRFRAIVREIYPRHFISESLKQDGPSIASIAKSLNVQVNSGKVEDKVLKQNIWWLVTDLEELCGMINEYYRTYPG